MSSWKPTLNVLKLSNSIQCFDITVMHWIFKVLSQNIFNCSNLGAFVYLGGGSELRLTGSGSNCQYKPDPDHIHKKTKYGSVFMKFPIQMFEFRQIHIIIS